MLDLGLQWAVGTDVDGSGVLLRKGDVTGVDVGGQERTVPAEKALISSLRH